MQIAAGDAAIGGHGTFVAPILEPDEGPPTVWPLGAPDMHLIAAQLSAARQMPAPHLGQVLVTRHFSRQIEETQSRHASPRSLDAKRIIDPPPQHLIAAADAKQP